ncbi:type II secretion system F family protein [Streptomyces marincola]|uniref:type II secretion system F family protein n=1 Tax=Streptomyces marincola TaxID=2878388 RepID=UPI001CF3257E|nr:type II secretion system F family protein [Streptomyces marincola]UCM88877.1 type II secretion system F family protein [Streptomyces marincola]
MPADGRAAVLAALLALAAMAVPRWPRGGRAVRGRLEVLRGEPPGTAARARRAPWRLPGPRPPWRRSPAGEDGRLALAGELLAACLIAGASPGAAADAVGAALGGPLGERLRRAAHELRLGREPAAVWAAFGRLPGAGGLARRLASAETSGTPMVAAVTAEAAETRARRRRAAQVRVRRAAVHVTGPLGLCFLPAFLLIGVAPVVIGMAGELL